MALTVDEIREAAEGDLLTFVRLVAPHRVLGRVHEELLRWMTRPDARSHRMVLMPRDHQKSAMAAYYVAWEITRNPAITVLYVSSTSNLAEKQVKFIKDILTSKVYRRYWPDMVAEAESDREKWTNAEFSVDHPLRKEEGVRDATVFAAGLTTGITGLHCNLAVLDDCVVQENAYTKEGRDTVKAQYSLLASIETADARELVVGTRYHPADLYADLIEMTEDVYGETGELIDSRPVYEVFEREVEDAGDGTGEFLWPRMQRKDGKWFGFNAQVLARKRAQYLDRSQFYAQYYNNPNDPGSEALSSELFQYYDKRHLEYRGGSWYINDQRLEVLAAMDFAYTLKASSDYSCIVVIGTDNRGTFYVLDIIRFKTNRITEYADAILRAHAKWKFRRIRCETTAAQSIIVEELKKTHISQSGAFLTVESFTPSRSMGSKEERIDAILRPRYEGRHVWHYRGNMIDELENELRQAKPKHDDVKDALATCIHMAAAPMRQGARIERSKPAMVYGRFGGVV
jgi:hypothetical protein